jgi:hypothetical protein
MEKEILNQAYILYNRMSDRSFSELVENSSWFIDNFNETDRYTIGGVLDILSSTYPDSEDDFYKAIFNIIAYKNIVDDHTFSLQLLSNKNNNLYRNINLSLVAALMNHLEVLSESISTLISYNYDIIIPERSIINKLMMNLIDIRYQVEDILNENKFELDDEFLNTVL